MMEHWILEEDHTVREASLLEWAEWFGKNIELRIVKREEFNEGVVSTVFLGLDHNYTGGDPHVFETMVFDKDGNELECHRCSLWDQAVDQHEAVVLSLTQEEQ